MPKPEGYKKAQRLYRMAERFRLPFSLSSTPLRLSGIGAEERGQAEAIAVCLEILASLTSRSSDGHRRRRSGGALALGVANRVLMLEFTYYS